MLLPMQIAGPAAPADDAVIARVLAGDRAAFEVLMRRYNRRVFRAARAVLRDDAEAEDVAQDAWVRAYVHLRQFAGRASFATWLTRIAFHEALARRRRRVRHLPLDAHTATLPARSRQPEDELGARQVAAVLRTPSTGCRCATGRRSCCGISRASARARPRPASTSPRRR